MKAMVSSIESMWTPGIKGLNCLANTGEVKEALKMSYPDVRNLTSRWESHLSTPEERNWLLRENKEDKAKGNFHSLF